MFKKYYDIQTEGEKAHDGYLATVHNPYPKESIEYSVWLLGWKQTEKRKSEEAEKHLSPKYVCYVCGGRAKDTELRNFSRRLAGNHDIHFIHDRCNIHSYT